MARKSSKISTPRLEQFRAITAGLSNQRLAARELKVKETDEELD
jgi:hypothetical protein